MDILIEVIFWSIIALFVGSTLWDIIKGVPTRTYGLKKGLNDILRIFLGIGVMLGAFVFIIIVPSALTFFKENLSYSLPYNLGPVSTFTSFYFVATGLFLLVYLIMKAGKIKPFKFSDREYEWERQKAEKERRAFLLEESKVKKWFWKVFKGKKVVQ